ncbi:NADP-dependent malic enzyme-like [Trifolium pratense]|uniref:NADP-dependent malic enzyme-like n=1 Tax=Trifolium pratense TaxID=57577 RepID=UPI001E696925|nr:NADP-dependent malic enzyme-like [Trifolium pratense]
MKKIYTISCLQDIPLPQSPQPMLNLSVPVSTQKEFFKITHTIVSSRVNSLHHFKKHWAHEHEPVGTLIEAVKVIKPTVLIGSSGVGKTFTKEVVEAMTANNKIPLILALSNPTSQSECTAEEAYTWSEVK